MSELKLQVRGKEAEGLGQKMKSGINQVMLYT